MVSMKYVSFPLVLALLICFTNAIPDDAIDSLCGEMPDKDFCFTHIGNDPRTHAAADYKGVLLVTLSQTANQVIDGSQQIDAIRSGVTDPIGQKRLSVCDSDYESALPKFQSAWYKVNEGAFKDVINFTRDGTNAVKDCEDVYKRDGPVDQSPLNYFNQNIIKLSEIALIINNKLLGQ